MKDYAQREKDRANEAEAVGVAINYLDSDEARDLFRDVAATFTQLRTIRAHKQNNARDRARTVLMAAGKKTHSAKLLVLAQTLQQNAVFDRVIYAINELEKELVASKAADQQQFDSCTGSINSRKTKVSELGKESMNLRTVDLK